VTTEHELIVQLPIGYAVGYYRELWSKGAEVLIGKQGEEITLDAVAGRMGTLACVRPR
jgi:alanine racemase